MVRESESLVRAFWLCRIELLKIMIKFVFLFGSFFAQANVFPKETDIQKLHEKRGGVKNPYNHLIPFTFKEETVKKAFELLNQKNAKVVEYQKIMSLFYQIKPSQIASLINERRLILGSRPDLKLVSQEEVDDLYQSPSVIKVRDFIVTHGLSSQHIFIVLFPFLRDESLTSHEMIELLESVPFDINTVLKVEDIASLFLDPTFQSQTNTDFEESLIKTPQSSLSVHHLESNPPIQEQQGEKFDLVEISSFLQALRSVQNTDWTQEDFDNFSNQEGFVSFEREPTYYNPNVTIGSLAHIVMKHKQEELIKFFYGHPSFDPNVVNHINQTPLHSLFMSSHNGFSKTERLSTKDWMSLLTLVFDKPEVDENAKDVHGLTPFALALSKGLVEVLDIFLERKEIDVTVKDHYNRSLVIIASHSLPQKDRKKFIDALVEKGGSELVTPSHFNDYVDESLNLITIDRVHPLRTVILQAFSILKEEKGRANNSMASLMYYDYRLSQSQKARERLRTSLVESGSPYYKKPVVQAIQKDDRDFFEEFYTKSDDVRSFLEHIFSFPLERFSQSNASGPDHIPSYHLLLLAIKENSAQVVKFFLETVKKPQILQPDESSFYMDALSEALIQSVKISFESLSSKEQLEQENQKSSQIIDAILSNNEVDLEFNNFMNLTPMEIAFLTGQMSQVQSLQERGVALPEGDLWDTGVSYLDLAERQGFHNLSTYFKAQQRQIGPCQQTFLN